MSTDSKVSSVAGTTACMIWKRTPYYVHIEYNVPALMVILLGKKLFRAVIEYVDMCSDSNGPSMFAVVNGPVGKVCQKIQYLQP
ncbi:MAG: hypothetical protein M3044_03250 [Thermoproteota archaeon]|nr:hypothetical protein [Thermoproteota archaeon]